MLNSHGKKKFLKRRGQGKKEGEREKS